MKNFLAGIILTMVTVQGSKQFDFLIVNEGIQTQTLIVGDNLNGNSVSLLPGVLVFNQDQNIYTLRVIEGSVVMMHTAPDGTIRILDAWK